MGTMGCLLLGGGMKEKEREKNPHAVALGRLGGLKGGPARTKALTPEQRRKAAQKAVKARWEKRRRTA